MTLALAASSCTLTAQLDELKGERDAGASDGAGGAAGGAADGGSDADAAPAPGPEAPFGQIAAGGLHACLIDAKSDLYCWGSNVSGQLGTGQAGGQKAEPVKVAVGEAVKAVACGGYHTCALATAGSVYCWGKGSAGQLGAGNADVPAPAKVDALGDATAISAGANHSCAIVAGSVLCWGSNSRGQLGVTGGNTPTPQKLTLSAATSLAAGSLHGCAIASGGLHCWGANESGQLGNAALPDQAAPVKVSSSLPSLAVVGAGGRHTCVAANDGTLECFGANSNGQLGIGVSGAAPVGPSVVSGISVKELALGDSHTCVVTTAGAAACFGDDAKQQIGNGTDSAPVLIPHSLKLAAVTHVAAGTAFSCAIAGSGQEAACWGDNASKQLGKSPNPSEPAPVNAF